VDTFAPRAAIVPHQVAQLQAYPCISLYCPYCTRRGMAGVDPRQ
jgi:hypothetical protein